MFILKMSNFGDTLDENLAKIRILRPAGLGLQFLIPARKDDILSLKFHFFGFVWNINEIFKTQTTFLLYVCSILLKLRINIESYF
jgi:hypothetical protein